MPRLSNSQSGLTRQRSILNAFRLKKQPARNTKNLQISEPILISPDTMDADGFNNILRDPLKTPHTTCEQPTFSPYEGPQTDRVTPSPEQCYSPPGLIDDDSCPESPETIYYRGHSRDNSELTAYWSSVKDDDEDSIYSTVDSDYISLPEGRESFALDSASIHTVERVQFVKPKLQSVYSRPLPVLVV